MKSFKYFIINILVKRINIIKLVFFSPEIINIFLFLSEPYGILS